MPSSIRTIVAAIALGVLVAFFAQLGPNVREIRRGFAENFDPGSPGDRP